MVCVPVLVLMVISLSTPTSGCDINTRACTSCNSTYTIESVDCWQCPSDQQLSLTENCTERRDGHFQLEPNYFLTVPRLISASSDVTHDITDNVSVFLRTMSLGNSVHFILKGNWKNRKRIEFKTIEMKGDQWVGSIWSVSIVIGRNQMTSQGNVWPVSGELKMFAPPFVTAVHPQKTILSGGTSLTVDGTDFIMHDMPYVYITETYNGSEANYTRVYSMMCHVVNGTRITGTAPKISQSRTGEEITMKEMDPTRPLNTEKRHFRLSFQISGGHLINVNGVSLDVIVYRDPVVKLFEPFVETYQPHEGGHITIKGERLLLGAQASDISVTVGDKNHSCEIKDVSMDTIRCYPSDSLGFIGAHNVKVSVGLHYHRLVGALKYEEAPKTPWTVWVCVAVALVLFIFFIAVLLAIYYRRRQTKKQIKEMIDFRNKQNLAMEEVDKTLYNDVNLEVFQPDYVDMGGKAKDELSDDTGQDEYADMEKRDAYVNMTYSPEDENANDLNL